LKEILLDSSWSRDNSALVTKPPPAIEKKASSVCEAKPFLGGNAQNGVEPAAPATFIAGSVLAFLLFEFGRKVDVANSHLTLCLPVMATGIPNG